MPQQIFLTSQKIKDLGWTVKSFSELGDHPLFSPRGIIEVSSKLIKSFWRGEFIWHGEKLTSESAVAMYLLTTLVFAIAGFINIISSRNSLSSDTKIVNYLHVCIVLSYILFLAILSIP
jgi:hypothetical protein